MHIYMDFAVRKCMLCGRCRAEFNFNTLRPGKMAANFLTTISNAFFWMKVYINFDYDFIEVCYQRSNQQYSSIGSDNGLSLGRRQAIIWTNAGIRTNHGLLFWIINVSLGPNELMKTKHICIFYRFWKLKRGKLKSFIIGLFILLSQDNPRKSARQPSWYWS